MKRYARAETGYSHRSPTICPHHSNPSEEGHKKPYDDEAKGKIQAAGVVGKEQRDDLPDRPDPMEAVAPCVGAPIEDSVDRWEERPERAHVQGTKATPASGPSGRAANRHRSRPSTEHPVRARGSRARRAPGHRVPADCGDHPGPADSPPESLQPEWFRRRLGPRTGFRAASTTHPRRVSRGPPWRRGSH